MKDRMEFTADGVVWGNNWGGGKSGYKAETVKGDSLEAVEKEVKKQLESGALDSGMGFESLYAAIMTVKIEDVKVIDGKEYINTEYENLFVGAVTENEEEVFFSM